MKHLEKELMNAVEYHHVDLKIVDNVFRDEYIVIIRGEVFQYFQGIGFRKPLVIHGKKSTVLDANLKINYHNLSIIAKESTLQPLDKKGILWALMMDTEGLDEGFEAWCDYLGFESDSRKAEGIYNSCLETKKKLEKIFSIEEIELIKKVTEDY